MENIKSVGNAEAYKTSTGTQSSSNVNKNSADQAFSLEVNDIKIQTQASLVEHLFSDPENAQQSALKITYQSAIEKLNERLSADLGLDSQAEPLINQKRLEEQGGMDYWSPENTASRIVQGSTAFLGAFQNAHPELEGDALIERFVEVIGGGIDQGFADAKGFLGELDVYEGSIADTVEQTYQEVQRMLNEFKEAHMSSKEESDPVSVE
ncbi:DUF5610 domain-containing protein [Thiomicrorhabdus sp.]|uniref:DUF5610 domain-containing protein n=1 Tax=Thiomicrorhabdus sp. TaxID=2039724 RepID=UPI0029C873C3|nr:DUF5610 domain-containing protein [Thiomicrorhabdus sp.]